MSDINLALSTESNFLDKTFEYNLQNRKIILNEEITANVVEKAIIQILNWNEQDDSLNLPVSERLPIIIYINTVGGSVHDGFVLCNIIETSKTPVSTITLGMSASMGAYIAMCGHQGLRKAYQFSTFLIHSGSICLGGNANDVESTMKYYTDMKDDVAKFVYKHTKISKKLYTKNQKEEWYLTASESLKYGLIDSIIE